MVPLLALFYVDTTQIAVGTSLGAIVFTSLSSTVGYARQRVLDFRLGLMLIPWSIAGAWLGAYLTEFISSEGLSMAFGVILIYVAGLMLWNKTPKELALKLQRHTADGRIIYRWPPVVVVGLFAGTAAGFFGIGGGIVMVPSLTLVLGVDIVAAVATSLFVMGPSALIGSIQHALLDNLRLNLALLLGLGIIVGAQLGASTTVRVPQIFLRRLFGVVMLYSAGNMIWNGLHP